MRVVPVDVKRPALKLSLSSVLTEKKGWLEAGVFAEEAIKKNAFVGNFVGTLINLEHESERAVGAIRLQGRGWESVLQRPAWDEHG